MGDPTGIGPEIIVRAWLDPAVHSVCRPIAIGRPSVFRRAIKMIGANLAVVEVDSISRRSALESIARSSDGFSPPPLLCFAAGSEEADEAIHPCIDARGGAAAHDALVVAAKACLASDLDAIVTAPLHKVALHQAGHDWPGHTELLAHLCGVDQYAMMLYLPPGKTDRGGKAGLGVVHVTLHMALREVFQHLSVESIFEKIELAQIAFTKLRKSLGLPPSPALAVAALNPHAGEGGLFGDEETRIIAPAVQRAIACNWNVVGPLSVDTLMPVAVSGQYDAVIAMYHDQGHIALKLLDMFDAVNITLGIPIIRTSVAHGTAHDIAWQGRARSSGMVQAIVTAARLGAKSDDV